MTRWLTLVPLAVLLVLALLFGFYSLGRDPEVKPRTLVGQPMPDLTLEDMDTGQPRRLADSVRDGPILVNFYASWCAPCEIEHPQLMALSAQGVRIVGIDHKDTPPRGSPAAARAMIARLGDPFLVKVADANGRAGIDFGITGVPETFVIGRDGKIIDKHVGPIMPADAQRLAALVR